MVASITATQRKVVDWRGSGSGARRSRHCAGRSLSSLCGRRVPYRRNMSDDWRGLRTSEHGRVRAGRSLSSCCGRRTSSRRIAATDRLGASCRNLDPREVQMLDLKRPNSRNANWLLRPVMVVLSALAWLAMMRILVASANH